MASKRIIHPGEILREEFAAPLGLTFYKLSKLTGIPQSRLSDIGAGLRGITADTAHRLARAFGNSPDFWMNLQTHYDLEAAQAKFAKAYKKIKKVDQVAA